jgi:WS/DGAT/MGAT family acyltransferase
MRQLSGLDNSFLAMETPTTYGHVSSLAIFEPGEHTLTFSEVRDLVAERLHLVAPFRRRLVTVPLGLDHPFWIEDPDFDLDYHLRHIAVPPPGDERQLAELAAELAAKHLDRRRPLWEMYIIEGLEGGAVAELTKIHHACIDGVSGAEILGVLLDISANPPPVPPPAKPWRPEHEPSQVELLGRGVAGLLAKPRVGFRLARRAVPRRDREQLPTRTAYIASTARNPFFTGHPSAPHADERHHHAAPSLRLRFAAPVGHQARQATAWWDGERRGHGDVRGCLAHLAHRARRAAVGPVARDGARVGAHR